MFDETYAQRDDIIKRETTFVDSPDRLILSGPHFMVGNPLYKTPRSVCTEKGHYDVIDHTIIPDDYLPRTNYVPLAADYEERIPTVDFGEGRRKVTEFYRYIHRAMLSQAGERTLVPIIGIKKCAHIDSIFSIAFDNNDEMIKFSSTMHSLILDFIIKTTGKSKLRGDITKHMPLIDFDIKLKNRTLVLNCLTIYYEELWEEQFNPSFTKDRWTKPDDPRLNQDFFKNLTPHWQRNVALRTDYERRQALVEIDVLVAQELGLSLEELKTIYRIQFPVLKQNEAETYYDMNGRIVFTVSKGLTGVGLPRKARKTDRPCKIVIDGIEEERVIGWEDIADFPEGEIHQTITDDTMPGGPIERTVFYKAPFAKCDREKDYEIAWAEFERRKAKL